MENEVKSLFLEGRNCAIVWKKKIWLLVAVALLGLVVGNILTLKTEEDKYMATAKVSSYSLNDDKIAAYGSLISSWKFCDEAVIMLQDDYITTERLQAMVSVVTTKNSPVITIQVEDTDKALAIKVANALAKVAVNEINKQKGENIAEVLEGATAIIYNNTAMKTLIIKFGCMFLAVFATLVILGIRAIMSKKIEVVEDFTCGGELAIIGMIPLYEDGNLKSMD